MEQSLNLIQHTTYSYTLGTDSFCEERTPRHDWYINDPISFCLWRIETRQPSFPWSRLPPLRHHAQGPAAAGVICLQIFCLLRRLMTMLIPNSQASWQEWDLPQIGCHGLSSHVSSDFRKDPVWKDPLPVVLFYARASPTWANQDNCTLSNRQLSRIICVPV